ncbi:MAG TPA: hypothetical protein PL033_09240 [Candidatus Brocadiia bacterium]|nr:hypothetical protein [Candidatus Brocadiia bacterium]
MKNRTYLPILIVTAALLGATIARAEEAKCASTAANADLVDLQLELPKPVFAGTPKNVPPGLNLEPARKGPRPAIKVPKGCDNLAKDKEITGSDEEPIVGDLKNVTDGYKEATEDGYVELGPGLQHVQIDLGAQSELYAVMVWHYHRDPRIYKGVVIQTADDPDFITNVQTLFNNDNDNSTGLGIGKDKHYFETYEGKYIDAKGVKARYIRLYSKGSTADDMNHYTEVEVYGKPAK